MKCSSCGFDSPEGMKFCGGCGVELRVACSTCQKDNPAGFKFCGHCGAPVIVRGVHDTSAKAPAPKGRSHDTAERRQLTLMFCDLVESTSLSESLDPEDLRDVIRDYQQVVATSVERYSGHIAQYLGDGLLIYFGFPRAHEDDAVRAVHCALETIAAMDDLNQTLGRSRGIELRVRIGLHTGDVVTGDIGAGGQTERLAVGTAPNIAARIQGMSKPGEVWLTEPALALTGRAFEVENLGAREIRGISEPITVYRAVRAAERDNFLDLELTPFVGRRRELRQILGLFELARHGQGQTIFLTGEPGHGKTRLQWEVRRQTASEFNEWLICRCSSYHENSTLHPFVELIQRIVGITPTQSLAEQAREFDGWMERQSPATRQSRRYLARLLGLPADQEAASEAPEKIRRRIEESVVALLFELAEAGPLVLTLEDLHWADNSTLELLDLLIRKLPQKPIMLICSARPSFTPTWTPTDQQTFISLMRFSDEEAKNFIHEYGPGRLPPMVETEIIRRADGVPLYLEELTRTLLENVKLVQNPQELSSMIPTSLRDSLTSRLDALGPAKEVVQLGALLGRHFTHEVLSAVSGLPSERLHDLLQRIVDSGLIRRAGSGRDATYAFKHALVQDAAYESLLKSRRRVLHELVVKALQEQFPAMLQVQPEMGARHMEGAELFQEAAESYRRAGAHGAARWSLAESIRNYRSALRCLAQLPHSAERDSIELGILEEMGEPITAYSGHGSDEQAELQRRVVEIKAPLGRDAFVASTSLWGVEASRGNRKRAWELAEQLAELSKESNRPEVLMHAAFATGCTAFYAGQLQRATTDLDRAVDLAGGRDGFGSQQADFQGFPLLSRLIRTWANTIAGRPETAFAELAMVEQACRDADQPFALAQVLCHTCVALQDIGGDPDEVLTRAEEIMQIAEHHDMGIWKQYAHLAAGWASAHLKQAAGLEELKEAVGMYTFDEVTRGHSLVMLADAHLQLDQVEPALATLDASMSFFETNLSQFFQPEALRMKAEVLHRIGRQEEAAKLLTASADLARRQGAGLLCARTALTRVDLDPTSDAVIGLRDVVTQLPEAGGAPNLRRALELARESTAL